MSTKRKNGIQELYEATIRAGAEVVILGRKYEKGDILLHFDDIQAINFEEFKNVTTANGGFDNRAQVRWESTEEVLLNINMGRVSQLGFGLMNANILKSSPVKALVPKLERFYVGNDGIVHLAKIPSSEKPFSVYSAKSSKILDYDLTDNTLSLRDTDMDIVVDYWFDYEGEAKVVNVGQKDLNGYLEFTGKFYYVDEYMAVRKTGLIEIPKMVIDSNFQITLGRNTNPLISVLRFRALPVGRRGNEKSVVVTYLDEDIDGSF